MFREQTRYGQDPGKVMRTARATFNSPLKWKDPRRVFTCSWSDFFIEEADAWRAEAWDIIAKTPHLTYQILTKRPHLIADRLPQDWGTGYPNVWLGVTTEDQATADLRIPILLNIPAQIHFLSGEPLLGAIEIEPYLDGAWSNEDALPTSDAPRVNWVIAGGESGSGFRPMDIDWARHLREQCEEQGVAFFYKQESGTRPAPHPLLDDKSYEEFPV